MKFRYFYALLCLILTVFTLNRSCHESVRNVYNPIPEIILPEGINHLLDNSNSELEETRQFERIVERFMQQWEITGASIAIMKDGKLLDSKGFGWADKEQGIRTDVRHIFRIASLSKLITATGIMKLCEQGRLSLGDRVFGADGILNDSLFRNIRDKRIEKITVEHLLRHQGGYSIRSGDPLFCSVSVAKQLGIAPPVGFDDMVRYAAETRLRYEPGSSNLYSNLGYVVLTGTAFCRPPDATTCTSAARPTNRNSRTKSAITSLPTPSRPKRSTAAAGWFRAATAAATCRC